MQEETKLQWRLEALWWIVTIIAIVAILFPIVSKVPDYRFLVSNVILLLVFITFTRYIFQLKHTFLGTRQKIKAGIMLISLPLTGYIIQSISNFQAFIDENGFAALVKNLTFEEQESLGWYIKTEYLFFGVAALFAVVTLFFRMIISIWRYRNKGTI